MATDISYGTTFTWTGFSADITSVTWSMSREVIDSTHMGTQTTRTFIAHDLYDPGEATIEFLLDGTASTPITQAATQKLEVQWGSGTATPNQWTANAYCTGYTANANQGEMLTGSISFKLTGEVAQGA